MGNVNPEYGRLISEIGRLAAQFNVRPSVSYTSTGNSPQEFIPADNTRFGIVLLQFVGIPVYVKWDNVFPVPTAGIPITVNTVFPMLFKFSDYGALVCQPWYMHDTGALGQILTWAPIVLG